jgi:hypothetical protein
MVGIACFFTVSFNGLQVFAIPDFKGLSCLANVASWTVLAFQVVNSASIKFFFGCTQVFLQCIPSGIGCVYVLISKQFGYKVCFPANVGEYGPFFLVVTFLPDLGA